MTITEIAIANLFNKAGHSIDTAHLKGLWLLFTDNTRDRKDMESYLFETLGSRLPKGINEKRFKKVSSYELYLCN